MVSDLMIVGVILDSKLNFEKKVRVIAAYASMMVGILRKTMSALEMSLLLSKAYRYTHFLCWSTVLLFGCLDPTTSFLLLIDHVFIINKIFMAKKIPSVQINNTELIQLWIYLIRKKK